MWPSGHVIPLVTTPPTLLAVQACQGTAKTFLFRSCMQNANLVMHDCMYTREISLVLKLWTNSNCVILYIILCSEIVWCKAHTASSSTTMAKHYWNQLVCPNACMKHMLMIWPTCGIFELGSRTVCMQFWLKLKTLPFRCEFRVDFVSFAFYFFFL